MPETTMIERVAQAILQSRYEHAENLSDVDAMIMARAAIRAMQEPTPEISNAVRSAIRDSVFGYEGGGIEIEGFAGTELWQAGIDAILSEPNPPAEKGGT